MEGPAGGELSGGGRSTGKIEETISSPSIKIKLIATCLSVSILFKSDEGAAKLPVFGVIETVFETLKSRLRPFLFLIVTLFPLTLVISPVTEASMLSKKESFRFETIGLPGKFGFNLSYRVITKSATIPRRISPDNRYKFLFDCGGMLIIVNH